MTSPDGPVDGLPGAVAVPPPDGAPPDWAHLDWAATAPLHPAARAALVAALDEGWADPAGLHRRSRQARALLDLARQSVAEVLGARPEEVFFAASGTDAAHLAVLGTVAARRRVGRRLVTSPVEHSCVLAAGEQLTADDGALELLPVSPDGRATLPGALPPDTALMSLQVGNQELGTLQPVRAAAGLCHGAGVPLHTDAAQAVGRVPVDVAALGVDLLTASAHKFGGPAGVGLLVVRTGTRWRSPRPADERGYGRAPGFENVPAIVATAAALRARAQEMTAEAPRLAGYVDRLRHELPRLVPDVELPGPARAADRLPHVLTASFLYVDGERLVGALDAAGFAVASGSACTASSVTPSHVLEAVGALTHGNLRISFGRDTDDAVVDRLLELLPGVVARLREEAGVAQL